MIPALAGDSGVGYVLGTTVANYVMAVGSRKVTFNGRSVMILPGAQTTGGSILSASIVSQKVLVEGFPIIGVGAVTSLATGYSNGIVTSTVPTTVSVV